MTRNDFYIKKINTFNIIDLFKVTKILYLCGKDMALKYDLHHWDNSLIKEWIIVCLCTLKNDIYLVYDEKDEVATFQIKKKNNVLFFEKLATKPVCSGKGIGSFCMKQIEQLAIKLKCNQVACDVYDQSEHAKTFYFHKGYVSNGLSDTLKYQEIHLIKKL